MSWSVDQARREWDALQKHPVAEPVTFAMASWASHYATRLLAAAAERDVLAKKLDSARAAMAQANDALESDTDLDQRRAAFERIQDEFEGVAEPSVLEQERDALAAHVERLREALGNLIEACRIADTTGRYIEDARALHAAPLDRIAAAKEGKVTEREVYDLLVTAQALIAEDAKRHSATWVEYTSKGIYLDSAKAAGEAADVRNRWLGKATALLVPTMEKMKAIHERLLVEGAEPDWTSEQEEGK